MATHSRNGTRFRKSHGAPVRLMRPVTAGVASPVYLIEMQAPHAKPVAMTSAHRRAVEVAVGDDDVAIEDDERRGRRQSSSMRQRAAPHQKMS
mmetsp:Transcript_8076/g.17386  ORF Transcript_8076/g.17386 Transcript_8076/m.17386 type:complete len:93 (-) Transcript_8076:84-362(-)